MDKVRMGGGAGFGVGSRLGAKENRVSVYFASLEYWAHVHGAPRLCAYGNFRSRCMHMCKKIDAILPPFHTYASFRADDRQLSFSEILYPGLIG